MNELQFNPHIWFFENGGEAIMNEKGVLLKMKNFSLQYSTNAWSAEFYLDHALKYFLEHILRKWKEFQE